MDESGDATQGVEGENLIYIRKADGSPAVQLASKFSGRALSPDGRFLLTAVDEQNDIESGFGLLPLGPGTPARVETGLQSLGRNVAWFPDSNRIAYSAREKGHKVRTYVQEIQGPPSR